MHACGHAMQWLGVAVYNPLLVLLALFWYHSTPHHAWCLTD